MLANSSLYARYRLRFLFFVCFLLGASYPWSIAISNFTLAICGIIGMFLFQLNDLRLFKACLPVVAAIGFYLIYYFASIFWSIDPNQGWFRMERKWAWIVLFPLTLLLINHRNAKNWLFTGITWGLGTHLILCFMQWIQFIPIHRTIFWGTVKLPIPSTPNDPTGLLDHIHFGIIYGMYAVCVFHLSVTKSIKQIIPIIVALIGVFFAFISHGRSGYIIIVTLFLFVIIMDFKYINKKILSLIALFAISVATVVALNPTTQKRIANISHDPERLLLWDKAIQIWQLNPLIGSGAGSYDAAKNKLIKREYSSNSIPDALRHNHPHSIYLWHLSNGGIIGLLSVLILFSSFLLLGIKYWMNGGYLISIAGLALSAHGLFNDSLEQHFPLFAGILTLSLGMAEICSKSHKKSGMAPCRSFPNDKN